MRFADSYAEAEADLKEFLAQVSKPVGMLLGHRGTAVVEMGLALDPCGQGFGCARATFSASGGTTRGLFSNVSDEVAHHVVIRVGNAVVRYPLSVQPGESSAFELPAELGPDELATLTITADFVASADPRRSVLLLGVPGDITAPRRELAKRFPGIDPSGKPRVITYTEEALELARSTTHPAAAQSLPGQILDAPIAVVAFLDEHSKVIGVLRPSIVSWEADSMPAPVTSLAFGKMCHIGFVNPKGLAQVFISVGGADP